MPARKRTAAILALLLGTFGVHRFYLHRWASGVLYLLFCWSGIPTVLGLVDAVRLARMTGDEFTVIYQKATRLTYTPDRSFCWNGQAWVPTLSPDGAWRWDGLRWVSVGVARSSDGGDALALSQQPSAPPRGLSPVRASIFGLTPGLHRHSGVATAIALAAVFVGALAVGAVADSALNLKRTVGMITLVELTVAAALVGVTYFFVWVFGRFAHDPETRHRQVLVGIVVSAILSTLAMSFLPAAVVARNPRALLLALPATALGLWFWRRLDRNEKEPWRLVLVTVVWGGTIAVTFALVFEDILSALTRGTSGVGAALGAGVFEEIPKGFAVLLLAQVFGDEFDGPLDGIVYGAAVGLGFNLVESIGYAAVLGPNQLVLRQTLGQVLGHPLWTALIGAGIGLARVQPARAKRLGLVVAGFLAAIFGHFAWDANLMTHSPVWEGLLSEAVLGAVLLSILTWSRHTETLNLAKEIQDEVATGQSAITPDEILVLKSAMLRARQRRQALLRGDIRQVRRVGRLQEAQITLALERWHAARHLIEDPTEAEALLRARVLAIKAEMGLGIPVAAVR